MSREEKRKTARIENLAARFTDLNNGDVVDSAVIANILTDRKSTITTIQTSRRDALCFLGFSSGAIALGVTCFIGAALLKDRFTGGSFALGTVGVACLPVALCFLAKFSDEISYYENTTGRLFLTLKTRLENTTAASSNTNTLDAPPSPQA